MIDKDIENEGIKRLAAGIALQAIKDYREAWRARKRVFAQKARLSKKKQTDEIKAEIIECNCELARLASVMNEVENFFNSPFGEECSGVAGDVAVEKLRERLRKEGVWTQNSIFLRIDTL